MSNGRTNLVHSATTTLNFAQLVYYRIQWEKFEGCYDCSFAFIDNSVITNLFVALVPVSSEDL